MNREEKEEEAENENESLSGSAATAHKSPGKWLKPKLSLKKAFCFDIGNGLKNIFVF